MKNTPNHNLLKGNGFGGLLVSETDVGSSKLSNAVVVSLVLGSVMVFVSVVDVCLVELVVSEVLVGSVLVSVF